MDEVDIFFWLYGVHLRVRLLIAPHSSLPHVRMDSDRIRMKSDPNVTFYHILIQIQMRMPISSNMNTKRIVRIRIRIRIPSRFET